MQLLSNVAERLAHMHEAGYVHRDLKPGNVTWLPRENRWTIIDFGCAARIGIPAPVRFSLAYAAPEVLRAVNMGAPSITSCTALDAWSLGVLAFELLTGTPAFRFVTDGRARVRCNLLGFCTFYVNDDVHRTLQVLAAGTLQHPCMGIIRTKVISLQ